MGKKDVRAQVEENYKEFAEEVASLSSEDMNNRLARLAKDREDVDNQREQDQALADAKSASKELGAPYRDASKAIRLKSRYLIALLKDRGEL